MAQKVIVVSSIAAPGTGKLDKNTTKELNEHLDDGWMIRDIYPMGGAGGGDTMSAYFASMVILIKDK